ncbi:hypothetical protein QCD60_26570 [Pokkaliibacter sp. MBI-7]|uniref:DNA topoisomerase I n=1 Tax=Proteobacteria bacterium 228 TaxID=2083153 RepID=A0A2S5KQG7_9PROT|nr:MULTISPECIES: hypothetical protein [Pokkaliibacter]MDH2436100.1 hypothetical protein [Pokkaliibacter sp. MBI-7]PPC76516.1 hypothetical protein C4K68_15360 [Pokkaliibacter plantistimulans]
MWLTVVIAALLLVLIASLFVSHLAYKREQAMLAIEQRFGALRSRTEFLQEIQSAIQHLIMPPLIWNYLIDFHISLLTQMKEVKPDEAYLNDLIEEQEALRSQQGVYQVPATDRSIVRAQKYIKYVMRTLRQMRGENMLSAHQLDESIHQLSYVHNVIEIDAHTQQGIKALEQRHYQEGVTHLKHAKAMIARTVMHDEERQERTQKVDQYLANPYSHPAS